VKVLVVDLDLQLDMVCKGIDVKLNLGTDL
jgi:hypothetical protein